MTTSPTLLPQTVPASPRRWTSRWDDLAITRKLGIIGVLALAGLVIPVLLYSGKLNESVTISSNELRSYAPLGQMLGLINDLHAAHVDTGSAASDAAQRAERDLTQLLATTATLPGFERSQKELRALQQRHVAGAAAEGYAAVSEQAFAALDALRDDSQLVYTPYIESYHLVVYTLIYSPDATESLIGKSATTAHHANARVWPGCNAQPSSASAQALDRRCALARTKADLQADTVSDAPALLRGA